MNASKPLRVFVTAMLVVTLGTGGSAGLLNTTEAYATEPPAGQTGSDEALNPETNSDSGVIVPDQPGAAVDIETDQAGQGNELENENSLGGGRDS